MTSQRGNFVRSSDPARLLLNGAGWSKPQSQISRTIVPPAGPVPEREREPVVAASDSIPWFWYPGLAVDNSSSCSLSFSFPPSATKVKGLVYHSVRAHPGVVRSVATYSDECTVFTAGVGPSFRGSVQRWDLATASCISGYDGHDEVSFNIQTQDARHPHPCPSPNKHIHTQH